MHGWHGKTLTCSNAAIKDAYLALGDFNVILVDWSDYALDINFFRVINLSFELGKKLNSFTRFLNSITGVRFKDTYLIGHSAGNHIAGITGKQLRPDRYGVIYALDSSGPVHRRLRDEYRLLPSDAISVESIQTDVGLFGEDTAKIGHASFYPNWGLGQPHCPNATSMEPIFVCDHFSSLYYFVESLSNPKAFGAIKCKNYASIINGTCGCGGRKECPVEVYMGGDPAVPKKGIFYLSTRKSAPRGMGNKCRMRKPVMPTIQRVRLQN